MKTTVSQADKRKVLDKALAERRLRLTEGQRRVILKATQIWPIYPTITHTINNAATTAIESGATK